MSFKPKSWQTFVLIVVVQVYDLQILQVNGDSCPYDGELTASKMGSLTIFNQSLSETYDRLFGDHQNGMECSWTIEAVETSKIVRLTFTSFHLINSTFSQLGDCVSIYDGDRYYDRSEDLIQELCDRMPEDVYNSTGDHLTVVFRQGSQAGRRWISMNYTTVDSTDGELHTFWSTTFGRILFFLIVIAIFSSFGFIYKSCKSVSSVDCGCVHDGLGHCWQKVTSLASRCSNLFKSASPEASETASNSRTVHTIRLSEEEAASSDIVTITGVNEQGPGPDLSQFLSGDGRSSSEGESSLSTAAPPPEYSTVFSLPPSTYTSSAERQDGGGGERGDVYSSSVQPDTFRSSLDLLPPPPPDADAPPSYELPAPPSYDSLFSTSRA